MTTHPRAGQPADPAQLVDVDALLKAYYATRPDPSVAGQRIAFGTSGHRGSALHAAFNEDHILAVVEATCRYRQRAGTDGPLFLGRDTHALSQPAFETALDVLAAHDVDVRIDATESERVVNVKTCGVLPGMAVSWISPSQVLQSQPRFEIFWR